MPRHARRRRRSGPLSLLVGVAVVAVVAAAVAGFAVLGGGDPDRTGAPSSSEPTTAATRQATRESTPEPVAPAPSLGACYPLTAAALTGAHDETPPVPCASDHTAQTYAVETLADDDLGDPARVDAARLAERAGTLCRAALPAHLGTDARTLALLRLRPAWFVPTEDELALGARWLRCDVVAERDETRLARLPEDTAGMVATTEQQDRWTTCAQGSLEELQAGRGQRMCAVEHDWRAVGTRRVGAERDPWPGQAAAGGRVLARCEEQVRAYTDDVTASVTVGWLPPTQAQWENEGLRFGLCWARTT